MLKTSKSLINRPVISLRTGHQIALAAEPVINPHNLKILGWWCHSVTKDKHLILLTEDVREDMPKGLAVNDESDLSLPEDLTRHKEVLQIQFELLNKPVKVTGQRQKMGKVDDYAYDESMFIQKLYVAKPLTKVFAKEDILIVGRNQISEVSDHYILVKGTEIHATQEDLADTAEAVA